MNTVIKDYDLSHNNTFAMRARCSEWIEFDSVSDLETLMPSVKERKWKVIGAGSNLLFTGDYDGVILHSNIKGIEFGEPDAEGYSLVRVGSGETLDEVIATLASRGLWGAENLSGIPGEAGAGAVQNVGAYGVEIKDILSCVEAFDTVTNRMVLFDVNECEYAYRDSRFKHSPDRGRYIITSVTLRVTRRHEPRLSYGSLDKVVTNAVPTPVEVREAVIATRRQKLPEVAVSDKDFADSTDPSAPWPSAAGSAGSYFKNPIVVPDLYRKIEEMVSPATVPHFFLDNGLVKIPAAWLIEQCGFKGYRKGNVGVWYKQPLILVNLTGHALPQEIISLERRIVDAVNSRFGILLTPEVEKV